MRPAQTPERRTLPEADIHKQLEPKDNKDQSKRPTKVKLGDLVKAIGKYYFV